MRLGSIRDPDALPLLVAALREQTALQVVDAIEDALVSYGDHAVAPLSELLVDESASAIARASAASVLAELGTTSVLGSLAAVSATHADPWLDAWVTIARGRLGDASVLEELARLAHFENVTVREHADSALARLQAERADAPNAASQPD